MYHKYYTKRFQKSFKKILRSGKISKQEVEIVVNVLASGSNPPVQYQDHSLHGIHAGFRECHIRGDILLVYKIEKDKLILVLVNIGSHSQLF